MSDIDYILDLERPTTSKVTRESFFLPRERNFARTRNSKLPMNRELQGLLYNYRKDVPPLPLSDEALGIDTGYKQEKAQLGIKSARKWKRVPYTNSARSDGVVFYHWIRVGDEPKPQPSAKFNTHSNIPTYTAIEYDAYLHTNIKNWNKEKTDHLFDLAERFDLRFIVMADRWNRSQFGVKSVEDLKERYYEVVGILSKARRQSTEKIYVFNADHERKRKEQLDFYWNSEVEKK